MFKGLFGRAALLSACLAVVGLGAPAFAATVDFQAIDNGYYRADGSHRSKNTGIAVGGPSVLNLNNWFLFDLSSLAEQIVSATLTIYQGNGAYVALASSAEYSLHDVTTDLGALRSGAGGAAAYADLGSGVDYGSSVITAPKWGIGSMPEVVVDLSGALTDLNGSRGGLFALGGSTDLKAGFLWAGSHGASAAKLTLETAVSPVPLPAGGLLLISAVAGAGLLRRRRPGRAARL